MVYLHLVFVLGDAKYEKEAVSAPGCMETTREEGHSRFSAAHAYTRERWKSAIDSFESFKNCCSNDEKYQFIYPEHLGDIHKIRRRPLSLAESALACFGHLDNWTAESYSSQTLKNSGEFLAARIIPAFIEQGPKYDTEK